MLIAAEILIAASGLAAVFVPIAWMLLSGRSDRSTAPARATRRNLPRRHEHERAWHRPQVLAAQRATELAA